MKRVRDSSPHPGQVDTGGSEVRRGVSSTPRGRKPVSVSYPVHNEETRGPRECPSISLRGWLSQRSLLTARPCPQKRVPKPNLLVLGASNVVSVSAHTSVSRWFLFFVSVGDCGQSRHTGLQLISQPPDVHLHVSCLSLGQRWLTGTISSGWFSDELARSERAPRNKALSRRRLSLASSTSVWK